MTHTVLWDVDVDMSNGCYRPRDIKFECQHCKRLISLRVGCGMRFDSFCPSCAKRWRAKTFSKYFRAVLAMKHPKFLTLTLKRTGGHLAARLLSLWTMKKTLFLYLARLGYHIPMWCAVIEPPNHVHLVIDTKWIPQHIISDLWRRITGDSYIVDIRPISGRDPRQIAAYITKYLTKSSAWEGINLDMLKGFHLIGSWGLPPQAPSAPLCVCGEKALLKIPADCYAACSNFYRRMWKSSGTNRDWMSSMFTVYLHETPHGLSVSIYP